MLQAVIVEDTFARCPFTVYPPVFLGIPWDAGMEAEVAVILYVDGASVVSGGTFFCMGTLSEAGSPTMMSDTISLQETVPLSSSLPSSPGVLSGFILFLPLGRRECLE